VIEDAGAISQAVQNVPKEFYYPLGIAVMLFIRQEAKVKQLEKDIENIRSTHHEERDKLWSKFDTLNSALTQVIQTLARLEGKLDRRETNP
jgi:hypothetical protein